MGPPLVRGTMSRRIEHRLTKPNHPWGREDQITVRGIVFPKGGQIERMNRTIKEATVKRFPYENHDQLQTHLADFILRRCQRSTELLAFPPHLQPRTKTRDPKRPNTVRIHLQNPDFRAR